MAGSLDGNRFEIAGSTPVTQKDERGRQYIQVDDMIIFIEDESLSYEPRIIAAAGGQPWPNRTVPIAFGPGSDEGVIRSACRIWEDVGIIFVEHASDQGDYVRFVKGTSNNAPLGLYKGRGVHQINIASWLVGVVAHEIAHLLGMQHEHQRQDRDKYIEINTSNIKNSMSGAFAITNTRILTDYDFSSLMHYDQYIGDGNFVNDTSQPVYVLRPEYAGYGGNLQTKTRPTQSDVLGMRKLYGID